MRTMLEKMLRAGHPELVLQVATRHFENQHVSSGDDDVWVCVHACWAAGACKEWGKAADWAGRGLRLKPRDLDAEGRLRFYGGTALFYTSDFYGAEEELQKFHKVARRCPNLESLTGDAFYNLAYVMRALKHREAEIAAFRQAVETYSRHARSGRVNVCHYEIAWSYLLDEQPDCAFQPLEAAQRGVEAEPDSELGADIETAWALFRHLTGDHKESRRLCLDLMARLEMAPKQLADVVWILARNALAEGDLSGAVQYIDQAYSTALGEWIPTQFRRIEALRAQVQAVSQGGR